MSARDLRTRPFLVQEILTEGVRLQEAFPSPAEVQVGNVPPCETREVDFTDLMVNYWSEAGWPLGHLISSLEKAAPSMSVPFPLAECSRVRYGRLPDYGFTARVALTRLSSKLQTFIGPFVVEKFTGEFHSLDMKVLVASGLWYARALDVREEISGSGKTPHEAVEDLKTRAADQMERIKKSFFVVGPTPAVTQAELASALTRLYVGTTQRSTPTCDYYDGLQGDALGEAEKVLQKLGKLPL